MQHDDTRGFSRHCLFHMAKLVFPCRQDRIIPESGDHTVWLKCRNDVETEFQFRHSREVSPKSGSIVFAEPGGGTKREFRISAV